MIDALAAAWFALDARDQDLLVLAAWIAPVAAAFALLSLRYRPWPLVRALLVRHRGVAATSVALIAFAIALGVALLAEERGLRQASARAAERFDLIVAVPGSDVTAMLATVYLQPTALPLLPLSVHAELAARPDVALAAPLAFGDSVDGAPLVGTTAAFVAHLGGPLAEGRVFRSAGEAVAGATSGLAVGDRASPAHGLGDGAEAGAHAGVELLVTGRMAATGTPWDRAVIVPLETLWIAHGLGDGHAADARGRIGPPWDAGRAPGVPAVVVRATSLAANYALRAAFTDADRMAFFPGEVLARLHGLLGDVRRVLSAMALFTQLLVVAAVIALLTVLLGGSARRFAMLRALGAPRGFVFAVAWLYGGTLVVAGALAGVVLGRLAALALAHRLARASSVAVVPVPAIADLSLVAGFVLAGAALATLPAWRLSGRRVLADLRA